MHANESHVLQYRVEIHDLCHPLSPALYLFCKQSCHQHSSLTCMPLKETPRYLWQDLAPSAIRLEPELGRGSGIALRVLDTF